MGTTEFAFLSQTCVLVGIVAGATYAGTSSLFAAYLAGVIVSWFDGLIAEAKTQFPALRSAESHGKTLNEQSRTRNCKDRTEETPSSPTQPPQATEITPNDTPTGELIYAKYYKEPVNRILLPLFFVGTCVRFRKGRTNTSRHPSGSQSP